MYYRISSISSLIIYFGDIISEDISAKVLSSYHKIKDSDIEGLIEIVPSYTTLFIEFDIFLHTHASLFDMLKEMSHMSDISKGIDTTEIVTIPTYYDEEVGLDLSRVAQMHGVSIPEVIEIHSRQIYTVYTIGFAPGFAYMGSVDERIATPRLSTPRTKIPKGSVSIANTQCAVYPSSSPGGWNILGRTYIEMFDREIDGFSYLKAGDRVCFESISRDAFLSRGGEI